LFAGILNGLMVGAATLLVILRLTRTGLTSLLGFAVNSVADIAAVATEAIDPADVEEATAEPETATPSAETMYDRVRDGAWGTLVVMLLSLAAATVGSWSGRNEALDLRACMR
jgi:hypothetical protein